jgi:hypothetical protein
MKRVTDSVYNLLECSLRTTNYVIVLLMSVETGGVRKISDQHLTRPEEEPEEEEEVAKHKVTFLDTMKGLEAARKHTGWTK